MMMWSISCSICSTRLGVVCYNFFFIFFHTTGLLRPQQPKVHNTSFRFQVTQKYKIRVRPCHGDTRNVDFCALRPFLAVLHHRLQGHVIWLEQVDPVESPGGAPLGPFAQ